MKFANRDLFDGGLRSVLSRCRGDLASRTNILKTRTLGVIYIELDVCIHVLNSS